MSFLDLEMHQAIQYSCFKIVNKDIIEQKNQTSANKFSNHAMELY